MKTLDMTQIANAAPAALAEHAGDNVSARYAFISTKTIIEDFHRTGWHAVRATNTRANPVGFHMLRFRQADHAHQPLVVGDTIPEIVLTNSHNGKTSFKMNAGLFRLVCSNGLVVSESMFGAIRIPHYRYTIEAVQESVAHFRDGLVNLIPQIETFKARELSHPEAWGFADSVAKLRWPKRVLDTTQLLQRRRNGDKQSDLWTVLNVIQENIMRGGVVVQSLGEVETFRRAPAIKAPKAEIEFNKGLFDIARSYLN